jgi:hypothetical protein
MTIKRVTDRSLLRFAEEVKDRFSFLGTLGFRRVRSEPTLVRFESSKMSINVYHGRRSFEIDLEIEPAHSPADAYSFAAILRLIDRQQLGHTRSYATHTAQGVAEGVRELAELFQQCIATGILNDSELFSRLKTQSAEWARDYAFETQLEQALKKFESAWATKDFGKVVQILAPFQEHLSQLNLKKLEYARKHSDASN